MIVAGENGSHAGLSESLQKRRSTHKWDVEVLIWFIRLTQEQGMMLKQQDVLRLSSLSIGELQVQPCLLSSQHFRSPVRIFQYAGIQNDVTNASEPQNAK